MPNSILNPKKTEWQSAAVSRRDFLKQLGASAVAGSAMLHLTDVLANASPMCGSVVIAGADLPEAGQAIYFDVTGASPNCQPSLVSGTLLTDYTLSRKANGDLVALSRSCTHSGCRNMTLQSDAQWTCPCHGSRFTQDGVVVQGPAGENLPRYTTALDENLNLVVSFMLGSLTENLPAKKNFELEQNYPNPFNPETAIRYQLNAASEVSLKVVDALGREVQTLVNGRQAAGNYTVRFNAAGLPSGTYFYRLLVGERTETKQMTLLK